MFNFGATNKNLFLAEFPGEAQARKTRKGAVRIQSNGEGTLILSPFLRRGRYLKEGGFQPLSRIEHLFGFIGRTPPSLPRKKYQT